MNNPIMYADPSGHFPWLIIPVILLVAVFAKDHKTDLKEEDININGTSSGKVKIKITENNIEIESSYRYGHEDMVFILNTIKNHELYKKYNYNRDIESYLAEWKAHNFAYYVMPFGEIGKQTRTVNLDRNEDQDVFKDWYWIFRLF